jgi:hypothetical protein
MEQTLASFSPARPVHCGSSRFDPARLWTWFAIVCISASFCGCASVPKTVPVDERASFQATGDRYAVDIETGFGKPVHWEGPVIRDLTVQGALEASGALRRIRVPEIEIIRVVPESGQLLRLKAQMQPGKRVVKYEQDYAILPGDRLIVRQVKGQNPLEKALGSAY